MRSLLLGLVAVALTCPQQDLSAAAQEPPRPPRPRPEAPEAATAAEGREAVGEAPSSSESGSAPEAAASTQGETPEEPRIDEAALVACERKLRALDVRFERLRPIEGENGCGVAAPYNVRRIAEDVILKPDTELTCEAALAVARWAQEFVVPAAEALGDDVRLEEITHASTYVCRHRNSDDTAKISEHAAGAAIDIAGFDLAGHDPIPVVPRAGKGTIEEAFQRSVRAAACLHFTTVLGPGADEYHDDHLHLDVLERTNGYRICQ